MHRKQLGRACARAFEFNDLGMLCLCEVGTNKLDKIYTRTSGTARFSRQARGQSVNIWLEQMIHECCKTSIELSGVRLGALRDRVRQKRLLC